MFQNTATAMAFESGKRKRAESTAQNEGSNRDSNADGDDVDVGGEDTIVDLDGEEEETTAAADGKVNPFFAEVTVIGGAKGKNDGGSKQWRCNHCNKTYKSSLTRVRVHLLGADPGKKSQVVLCPVLLNNPSKYRALRDKVDSLLSLPFICTIDTFTFVFRDALSFVGVPY